MNNNLGFETYLIDRHDIVRKFGNNMFYRDTVKHYWGSEIKWYISVFEDADVVEEIEYDDENERIISLRNKPGFGCSQSIIDACDPCEQVIKYFESMEHKNYDLSDKNEFNFSNDINISSDYNIQDENMQFLYKRCLEEYFCDSNYMYFVTYENQIICERNNKTYVLIDGEWQLDMNFINYFVGNTHKNIIPIPSDIVDSLKLMPYEEQKEHKGHKEYLKPPKDKQNVKPSFHLENIIDKKEIYKISNIYFVRGIEYEYNDKPEFQLIVNHFEDGLFTVYTYRLNESDTKTFKKRFPNFYSIKNAFGEEDGDKLFCKYCENNNMVVEKNMWY